MRVLLIKNDWMQGRPELHLEPECERDKDTLEQLEQRCVTAWMGRNAVTGDLLHVRLPLTSVSNAKLLEAAPDLLKACVALMDMLDAAQSGKRHENPIAVYKQASEAIAKAGGQMKQGEQ